MYKLALLIPLVACAASLDDPRIDTGLPVSNYGGVKIDRGSDDPEVCALWNDPDALTEWAEDNVSDGACVVIRCPYAGFGLHACNYPDEADPLIDGVEIWVEGFDR